ncbi:MAG: hypothetical protein ACRED1_11320 [Limisphaerales bacterium]
MNNQSNDFAGQCAAFQKIWLDSMSRMMQGAFAFPPNSTPSPEFVREVRDRSLDALGESWDEFLRSPQFQESMKQWMDNAIAFREMGNDFMAKIRQELQAPSNEDIEAVQLSVRHLETRVLNRLDTLSRQIDELKQRAGAKTTAEAPGGSKTRRRPSNHNPASQK